MNGIDCAHFVWTELSTISDEYLTSSFQNIHMLAESYLYSNSLYTEFILPRNCKAEAFSLCIPVSVGFPVCII